MSKRLALLLVLTATSFLAFPAYAGASYSWPVKPFDRQHPIRGTFDDPRNGTKNGIVSLGKKSESFHSGVDIVAPDGTPVYAIDAGQVHMYNKTDIDVVSDWDWVHHRAIQSFGYWHIVPVVRRNQLVRSHQLLGYVLKGHNHVHLTERRDGRIVNPLRHGGLAPYHDHGKPVIQVVEEYRHGLFYDLESSSALSGTTNLVVDAFDPTPMETPWPLDVVTPALIQWKLTNSHGKVVVPMRTVVDFLWHYTRRLTSVYAPGTLQNGPRQQGVYNFWLARNFDTTKLPNGVYQLKVVVSDIRGNRSVKKCQFTIAN
jgi:hypothetical protein